MDRAVVLLVSGASETLHVPFVLHLFGCILLNFPFICSNFLSLIVVFIFIHAQCSFHISFMFIPMCIHVLSSSTHFPFMLHSCPFISFLKFWKWLHGLAREPSATNGYR